MMLEREVGADYVGLSGHGRNFMLLKHIAKLWKSFKSRVTQ